MTKDKKSLMLKKKHDQALESFNRRLLPQSAKLLQYLLKQKDNAELWNDWATVQLFRGMIPDAERGYRRALELEPSNQEANVNFGILLAATGRDQEATPLLQQSAKSLKGKQRLKIMKILDQCEEKAAKVKSAL